MFEVHQLLKIKVPGKCKGDTLVSDDNSLVTRMEEDKDAEK